MALVAAKDPANAVDLSNDKTTAVVAFQAKTREFLTEEQKFVFTPHYLAADGKTFQNNPEAAADTELLKLCVAQAAAFETAETVSAVSELAWLCVARTMLTIQVLLKADKSQAVLNPLVEVGDCFQSGDVCRRDVVVVNGANWNKNVIKKLAFLHDGKVFVTADVFEAIKNIVPDFGSIAGAASTLSAGSLIMLFKVGHHWSEDSKSVQGNLMQILGFTAVQNHPDYMRIVTHHVRPSVRIVVKEQEEADGNLMDTVAIRLQGTGSGFARLAVMAAFFDYCRLMGKRVLSLCMWAIFIDAGTEDDLARALALYNGFKNAPTKGNNFSKSLHHQFATDKSANFDTVRDCAVWLDPYKASVKALLDHSSTTLAAASCFGKPPNSALAASTEQNIKQMELYIAGKGGATREKKLDAKLVGASGANKGTVQVSAGIFI